MTPLRGKRAKVRSHMTPLRGKAREGEESPVNCQGKGQLTNTLFSRPGCSGPTHFQSASMQHFPLRSSGRRILNYLDDWMILAQSLDTLISHIDSLLIHLESLGLCVNMQRAFSPPPLARSRGDESLPLVRSRGDESPKTSLRTARCSSLPADITLASS